MLCERCQQREATVFHTICNYNVGHPDETTTSGSNLCQECFEIEMPEAAMKMQMELERGCVYCSRKCGESICRRCRTEMQRFSQQIGLEFSGGTWTREIMEEHRRMMNALVEHVKKWVEETRPDLQDDPEDPGMLSVIPDAVCEKLAAADSRFRMEAYRFVRRAVNEALSTRKPGAGAHVSGRDVALAFRALAIRELGREALATLVSWGLYTTDDIGALVFQMIAAGLLGAQPEDRIEDFHAIYDFAEAFPRG